MNWKIALAGALTGLALFSTSLYSHALADQGSAALGSSSPAAEPVFGIQFSCSENRLSTLKDEVEQYLASEGIRGEWVRSRLDEHAKTLRYWLDDDERTSSTLDLAKRRAYAITGDQVAKPGAGALLRVQTVSRKEILLALLHRGRLTAYAGGECSARALKTEVGIRQNIVLWAQKVEFDWPDGGPAAWNQKYWDRGDLQPGVPAHVAINDAFLNNRSYGIGCYTAAKLALSQGVLDYFARVAPDAPRLVSLEQQLTQGGTSPLSYLEPGAMWSFEKDFDPADGARPGKLLRLAHDVEPGNYVPGDWTYAVNTDPKSQGKTGYEGSNAIYLGGGRFSDYYNDHWHSYSIDEKLDEVYQWRNGVFSRSRDAAKVRKLTRAHLQRLRQSLENGGLVLPLRAVPLIPGFSELPVLDPLLLGS